MIIIGVLLYPLFIYALVTHFKFTKNEKSKEKRDRVLASSSKYALGVFPIGWLILELYHRFIGSISYDTYRDAMWVFVLLLFTVHGFAINYYKTRQ